jgi:hypothetical protein
MTLSRLALGICLSAFAGVSAHAQSATNEILNGNFDETSNGEGAFYTGANPAPLGTTTATDWAACATTACNNADGGYPFIFVATPGIANQNYKNTSSNTLTGGVGYADPWDDPSGSGNGATGVAFRSVYGTGNGGYGPSGTSSTGAFNGDGPTGHTTDNFLVVDGDYHATVFSQSIGGQTDPTSHLTTPSLVVGDHYQLTFYWAAAQWEKYSGATTEQFGVSFGNSYQTTAIYDLPSHSFSGWMQATLNFTATSTNEMLSFLALGTPAGEPPILLLADVSMVDIPEPGAFALLGIGSLLVAGLARQRRAQRPLSA